jgi:hypothetical protein
MRAFRGDTNSTAAILWEAKSSVLRGLAQAKAGKTAKSSPNLDADALLAEHVDD